MDQIPNWFRWLMIVVATIIMCACRAPLQDAPLTSVLQNKTTTTPQAVSGFPLRAPVTPGSDVVSHEPLSLPTSMESRAPLISRREASANAEQRIVELLQGGTQQHVPRTFDTPTAKLSGSELRAAAEANSTPQHLAPVVKQTEAGIRVQHVESALATSTTKVARTNSQLNRQANYASKPTVTGGSADRAVYMRVNDGSVRVTGAQLDAAVGESLGSPFVDDPAPTSIMTQPPAAPVVDPSFLDSAVPAAGVADGFPVSAPLPDAMGQGPVLTDDAALPLEQQPIVETIAPYEEYLPVVEIPVEVAPEYWAAPPESRLPGANVPQQELARLYPDEYICDGGDANGPVFVLNDWSLRNLDPEDTVGHYDTKAGQVVVEPSNKVCIYAPRFAAARQVSSAFQNESHLQVLLAERETRAIVDDVQQVADQYSQTVAAQRHLLLQPASSFKVKQGGVEGIQRKAVNIFAYDVSTHEDFRVMKLGIHKQAEKARLAEFSAKAATWAHDLAVQVLVDEAVVRTNVSRRGAETIFMIGDNGPAKLRVIKTASTADALPGEEVEFTLRFDNIGYQTIGNVTVIDNLTTRLELIEDSDLCSVDCNFVTDDNAVESLTLRWEIKDPIEPGHGGLIRFRCRVR